MPTESEEKVKILTLTVQIIEAQGDKPILWKLNKEYLDALCNFLKITSRDEVCLGKFLDIPVDLTSGGAYCIGLKTHYPLIR